MVEQHRMRVRNVERNRPVVCKTYERLRRRWQNLVDGSGAQSEQESAAVAQDKMMEHRKNCNVCANEDQALRDGNITAVEVQ